MTAREIADRFTVARRETWAKKDPTAAVLMRDKLDAADQEVVRRMVAEAGYQGDEFDPMVKHVTDLIVGQVEALNDDMPATGSD